MFGQCSRCGLSLPIGLLVPVIARTPQGEKHVHVCYACEKIIKEQQGQNNG